MPLIITVLYKKLVSILSPAASGPESTLLDGNNKAIEDHCLAHWGTVGFVPTGSTDRNNTDSNGAYYQYNIIKASNGFDYICLDDTPTTAVWKKILHLVSDDTAPALGGNLSTGTHWLVGQAASVIKIDDGTEDILIQGVNNAGIICNSNGDLDLIASAGSGGKIHIDHTGIYDFFGGRVTNIGTPTAGNDAVSKLYVDMAIQGLKLKPTATCATTAPLGSNTYVSGVITFTGTGAIAIDSRTVALNDIVLVKDESGGNVPHNGLYVCTVAGAGGISCVLTRHADMDAADEFNGAFIVVENGTTNAGSLWLCNSTVVTVGATNVTFVELNKATDLAAGTGIAINGNVISTTTGNENADIDHSTILVSNKIRVITGGGSPVNKNITLTELGQAFTNVPLWSDSTGTVSTDPNAASQTYQPTLANSHADSGGTSYGHGCYASSGAIVSGTNNVGVNGAYIAASAVNSFGSGSVEVLGTSTIAFTNHVGNGGPTLHADASIFIGSDFQNGYSGISGARCLYFGFTCSAGPALPQIAGAWTGTGGSPTSTFVGTDSTDHTDLFLPGDKVNIFRSASSGLDTNNLSALRRTIATATFSGGQTTLTFTTPFADTSGIGYCVDVEAYDGFIAGGINCISAATDVDHADALCGTWGIYLVNTVSNSFMYGIATSTSHTGNRGVLFCQANKGIFVSGKAAKVGGVTVDHAAAVNSANSSSEQTIYTDTIAADTLDTTADKLVFNQLFNVTAAGGTKDFKWYLDTSGGTLILDAGVLTFASDGAVVMRLVVSRVSSTTIAYSIVASISGVTGTTSISNGGLLTVSALNSNALVLLSKVTISVPTTTGHVIGRMDTIEWKPAA